MVSYSPGLQIRTIIHHCLGILSYLDWHLALAADDIKHLKRRRKAPTIESIESSLAELADDHNNYLDILIDYLVCDVNDENDFVVDD